jgi:hypothetical protein
MNIRIEGVYERCKERKIKGKSAAAFKVNVNDQVIWT